MGNIGRWARVSIALVLLLPPAAAWAAEPLEDLEQAYLTQAELPSVLGREDLDRFEAQFADLARAAQGRGDAVLAARLDEGQEHAEDVVDGALAGARGLPGVLAGAVARVAAALVLPAAAAGAGGLAVRRLHATRLSRRR